MCVYVFSPLKKQISCTEKVIRTVSGIKPSVVVTYRVYHAQEFVPAFRVTGASEHTGNRRYPQVNPFADFINNAFLLAHQVLWKAQVLETDMPRFGFWFPLVLTSTNAPALSTPPVISWICASQHYWNDFSWAVWGKGAHCPSQSGQDGSSPNPTYQESLARFRIPPSHGLASSWPLCLETLTSLGWESFQA